MTPRFQFQYETPASSKQSALAKHPLGPCFYARGRPRILNCGEGEIPEMTSCICQRGLAGKGCNRYWQKRAT